MSFVGKLWRGDYGLARTFWLWGLVYPLVAGLLLLLVAFWASEQVEYRDSLTVVAIALAAVVVAWGYSIVWAVGLWRAAFAYAGFKLWSFLACLVSALTIVNLVVQTFAGFAEAI